MTAQKTTKMTELLMPREPPPWMGWAAMERARGVRERPGAGAEPRILLYLSLCQDIPALSKASDETAWCAGFVSWCLEQAGIKSTRSARARNYELWGTDISDQQFIPYGAIVVLDRPEAGPTAGHVTFAYKDSRNVVVCLGGNQANGITEQSYQRGRIKAVRWPYPIE